MPIYEFVCDKCNKTFEKFVLSSRDIARVRCPGCGSEEVKKLLSSFSCCSSGTGMEGMTSGSSCGTRRFG